MRRAGTRREDEARDETPEGRRILFPSNGLGILLARPTRTQGTDTKVS
jgi:hypothetical protein